MDCFRLFKGDCEGQTQIQVKCREKKLSCIIARKLMVRENGQAARKLMGENWGERKLLVREN